MPTPPPGAAGLTPSLVARLARGGASALVVADGELAKEAAHSLAIPGATLESRAPEAPPLVCLALCEDARHLPQLAALGEGAGFTVAAVAGELRGAPPGHPVIRTAREPRGLAEAAQALLLPLIAPGYLGVTPEDLELVFRGPKLGLHLRAPLVEGGLAPTLDGLVRALPAGRPPLHVVLTILRDGGLGLGEVALATGELELRLSPETDLLTTVHDAPGEPAVLLTAFGGVG